MYSTVSLGEISHDIRYGLTSSAKPEGTHRFIRITDVSDIGELKNDGAKYVDASGEEVAKYGVQEGDLLIARSGSIGRPLLVRSGVDGVFASYLIRFRINRELALPEYVFYFALSPTYGEYVEAAGRGAAIKNINAKQLAALEIPLPNINEQRRIVARIKECLERVGEAEALRVKSKEETRLFLRAYYHDLYEGLVASNPSRPLCDFGDVAGGGTPSKKRPDFWNGTIPWISPKEMKVRDIYDTSLAITDAAVLGSSVKLLENPAVIFVVRGMILAHTLPVAVNRVPVTLNQDMKSITPYEGINVDFLATMLRGAERRLLRDIDIAGHGTRRLQTEAWSAAPIPDLDLDAQITIVERVRTIEALADQLVERISGEEIFTLRGAILRKAFSGEL